MKPVKFGFASLKALGVFVAFGVAAHAAMPYLPLIGPAPMRVQTPAKSSLAVIQFGNRIPAAATNLPVALETKETKSSVKPAGTNNNLEPVISAAPSPAVTVPADDASVALPPTPVFALPTPDLFGVTPQMLATYFNPVPFGTNAFQVTFLPPLPPGKSSHAEYQLK